MPKNDRKFLMDLYTLATVGLNIVAGTFIGLGMGWFIDHKIFEGYFHVKTTPWFTLIFLLFGIIAGFKNMWNIVVTKGESEDEDEDDENQDKDK